DVVATLRLPRLRPLTIRFGAGIVVGLSMSVAVLLISLVTGKSGLLQSLLVGGIAGFSVELFRQIKFTESVVPSWRAGLIVAVVAWVITVLSQHDFIDAARVALFFGLVACLSGRARPVEAAPRSPFRRTSLIVVLALSTGLAVGLAWWVALNEKGGVA